MTQLARSFVFSAIFKRKSLNALKAPPMRTICSKPYDHIPWYSGVRYVPQPPHFAVPWECKEDSNQ